MDFSHRPVLLSEAVEALNVTDGGIYVDCTAGGGGHSAKILESIGEGTLIDIDQDPQAIETLKSRFAGRDNVKIVHNNFCNISSVLDFLEIDRVDGILADLGVSSHQLDSADRGFSFHKDAPLDMRMSMDGVSAADIVNTFSQQEIQKILFEYGEEKFAREIARNIVREREKQPINTTLQLAEIIGSSVPAKVRREGHPARKTFQALRIKVNGELEILDGALTAMFDALAPGGRLAVITFHSLEDRIVKRRFAEFCKGCTCPSDFPICVCGKKPAGFLPQKQLSPSELELEENPRSRSAKLRVVEKL